MFDYELKECLFRSHSKNTSTVSWFFLSDVADVDIFIFIIVASFKKSI